jgi:hypothetical protein
MTFTEQYKYLRSIFNPSLECIEIENSGVEIRNLGFISNLPAVEVPLGGFVPDDAVITENNAFNYPVFISAKKPVNNKAIILVHGLNEKSWSKYLAWAKTLCENTGKSVILFPIAFHINRAPSQWSDPREMNKLLEVRKTNYPDVINSTVINLALSERLTDVPQRFFLSGYNYADDLIRLLKDIKEGKHPLFEKDTEVDFFAYSIGVFMVQCLMLGGPEELFRNSKYVFFAGGSFFMEMNGISRFIMDSKAFERIYYYHMSEIEEDVSAGGAYSSILNKTKLGLAFRSMIAPQRHRKFREKALACYKDRVFVIALRDDKVMPVKGVYDLMWNGEKRNSNIKVMHFNFPYIHENPFPVQMEGIGDLLDNAFCEVFGLSSDYLC